MATYKLFRVVTLLLLSTAVVSGFLHSVLLLLSDSETYARWVVIQISIQTIGAFLLWRISKYGRWALLAFGPLSFVFAYINARYVNYGELGLHAKVFVFSWVVYGLLLKSVWPRFKKSEPVVSDVDGH